MRSSGRSRQSFCSAGATIAFRTHRRNPMRVYPGGITLTRANHLVLLEPALSTKSKEQAVGRV
mgnify:CR=1 FL=1